jgi:predicted amidophosphoribosyltransferase
MGPSCTLLTKARQNNSRKVLQAMTALMACQWLQSSMELPSKIVPVPLFWLQRYRRGFDLHYELALSLSELLQVPLQRSLQSIWDRQAWYRQGKIAAHFRVKKGSSLPESSLLLVLAELDDPLLQQAVKALRETFSGKIYALAFAINR